MTDHPPAQRANRGRRRRTTSLMLVNVASVRVVLACVVLACVLLASGTDSASPGCRWLQGASPGCGCG